MKNKLTSSYVAGYRRLKAEPQIAPLGLGRTAFTLVEMIISLTILAMICLSLGAAVIMARKLSEGAVYQGTALTAATGYLEQIKSMDYQNLVDAVNSPSTKPLQTKLDDVTPDPLYNGQANIKTITVDVDKNGVVNKTMKLTLTPTITNLTPATGLQAMEILITYTWIGPDGKAPHKRAIRSVRSYIPTY